MSDPANSWFRAGDSGSGEAASRSRHHRRLTFLAVGLAACVVLTSGCGGDARAPAASAPLTQAAAASIPRIPFTVAADYPHDANAWTQGLAYAGVDRLYEGTGDYENSSLREVKLTTGEVLRSVPLPSPQMYGEGITVWGDTILQLTWRDGVGLVRRAADFASLGQFTYPATDASAPQEGWGITTDGERLFVSDGSSSVYIADPAQTLSTGQLAVTDVINVTWAGQQVDRLNELEYVDGMIYANVWQSDTIVRFDAATGVVDGRLDIAGLLDAEQRETADTTNGIAYDPHAGQLFVTGKKWPRLFALRLG